VLERATVTDASGRPVDLSALRRQPETDEAAEADEPEPAPPAAPAGPASATSILPVGS
jgi:hypothetical protein